jgi:hypothetical protein
MTIGAEDVGDGHERLAGDRRALNKEERRMSNPRWEWAHGKYIEVETLDPPPNKSGRIKRKPFEIDWVKLPNFWIEQLEQSRCPGTYKLAMRILREDFKRQYIGGELVLSTAVTGVPRATRYSAIREMVELGLIRIKQEGNKAVRVTTLLFRKRAKPVRRGKNGR